jgi:protein involved in polysaccharide export with SLBB domain
MNILSKTTRLLYAFRDSRESSLSRAFFPFARVAPVACFSRLSPYLDPTFPPLNKGRNKTVSRLSPFHHLDPTSPPLNKGRKGSSRISRLSRDFLIWLIIGSMVWPLPLFAQGQATGPAPARSGPSAAAANVQAGGTSAGPMSQGPSPGTVAGTGEVKTTNVPTECLSPQSQTELQNCAKALEVVNPALVAAVRQALAQGDMDKAKTLINTFERQQEAQAQPTSPAKEEADKKAVERATNESPFAKLLLEQMTLNIQPFGYDLFKNAAPLTSPTVSQPVSPDYVLGPDDEFTVTVWGQVDGVYKVKVNRDGEVVFPRIGALSVAGVTFGELKNLLAQAFGQQFKGANVSVAMGQLRSIQVFGVGEVQKPGSYVLTSLSTALNMLFAAGGVTKNGTLRDIQVVRGGKVVAHLDLYQFLLKGDKSQDVRLQDQDAVFVPLVGPVVGVAGHVLRPAIFEVTPGATLGDVLNLAGGVRPTGYLTRVQIERIAAHERRMAVDINLAPAAPQPEPIERPPSPSGMSAAPTADRLGMPVQNMDMIKVFPISPVMQQVVYLRGNVLRPGPYELKPDMRIKNVVHGSEDLLPDTYLYYARVLRYIGPELAKQTISFNLSKALESDPNSNLVLQPLDEIEIYAREDLRAFPTVTVVGEVRKPGNYPLLRSMRISDLIVVAGGLQKLAYQKDAELTRYAVVGNKTEMQVKLVDLEKAMAGALDSDIELQELDALAVRPIPESEVGRNVTVQGEVRLPGQYSIKRGERLSSVLKRAGGMTERAFPPGLVLLRESVKLTQQAQLQKFIATQKQQLLAESAAYVAGSGMGGGQTSGAAGGQAQLEQTATAAQLQVLEQMATLVAPGRVVVKVQSVDKLEGSADDVLMEPGDQIMIPQLPTEVTVLGAVRNSTSVVHRPGQEVEDYIQQVGGMTREASKSDVYIVRADGSAESRYMSDRTVKPGDTIVVPQVIEAKTRPLQLWQAVAAVLGSVMLGVAAISVIGR